VINLFANNSLAINLTSNYYNIDVNNKIISRIGPKTSVEIFKKATNIQNGELKIYKDRDLNEEVTTGYVGTGMYVTNENGQDIYQISVIGDLDGDGIASQTELTHIIRNITGLNGYDLEGIVRISADINGDGNINQIDVTKYINYLVYGELDIKRPEPDFDLVAPEININVENKTTSTITVKVSATDDKEMADPFVYIYYIKEVSQPDSEYQHKKSTTDNTFTFTRLKINTNYTIKVETEDSAGNKGVKEISVKTEGNSDILEGTVQISSPVWENGKASVTVTTETNYDMEYQINGGEWIKLPEGQDKITNLNNRDVVNVRVTDGTNSGNYSSITIQDAQKPTVDLELGIPTTAKIQATASNARDEQTGIETPITYKFYIKKTSENDSNYQLKETSTTPIYTFTDLLQNTEYTIKVEVTDKAGNIGKVEKTATTETVSSAKDVIEVKDPVWNDGEASIEIKVDRDNLNEGDKVIVQINGGEWTELPEGQDIISGLNDGDEVHIKVTDGINEGEEVVVIVKDEIPPTVTLEVGTVTISSIQATANATDAQTGISDNATYKFYIKEATQEDSSYVEKQNTTSKICNFEGLERNKPYTIKVEVVDIAGNVGNATKEVSTSGIPGASESGAIIFGNETWNARKASITISTNTEYQIEYQVGSTTGEWTKVIEGLKTTTVTELNHNDIVYARLTDGTNSGSYGRKVIQDTGKPQIDAEINETTTSTIKVTAVAVDNESGISTDAKYNFYIKKSDQADTWYNLKQNTTQKECTFTELEQNVNYTVKVEVSDIAGNTASITKQTTTGGLPAGEGESGPNSGAIQFENPVWSGGKASIVVKTNTEYQIEYKVNGTTGEWTKVEKDQKRVTVTNLNHNDDIYARVTDGTNSGSWAKAEIRDVVNPIITLDLQPTASKIIATASATDNESGISNIATYKFSIKETNQDDTTYVEKQNTTDRVCTITGLTQNVSYTVKVEVSDVAENLASITKTATTSEIPSGTETGAIQFGSPSWNDGKASIVVSTTTNFQIQYQLGGTTGNWTKVTESQNSVTISNLNHGTVIYARLADGESVGNYTSTTIEDSVDPVATINLSVTGGVFTDTTVTATVINQDLESGINIDKCKWIINTTSTEIGTNADSYTGGTFNNTIQDINIDTSTEGIFYLHVLTVDNADNMIEKISGEIKVVDRTLKDGDFVKYNVTYIDVYSGYRYTAMNGWRILDANAKDDNGKSVVKLISTGIPGKLSFIYNNIFDYEYNGTDGRWAANKTQRQKYANKFYDTPSNDDARMYMAAGLYYNFTKIVFEGIDFPEGNKGYLVNINGTSAKTTGSVFLTGGATNVHNLTLTELNDARNRKEGVILPSPESSVSDKNDAALGLFKIDNLNKLLDISGDQGGYWLASPTDAGIYPYAVWYTNGNGAIRSSNTGGSTFIGIRPVVCIPSNIPLEKVIN